MIKPRVKVRKNVSPWHRCVSSEAKGGVEAFQGRTAASTGQNGNWEKCLRSHWEDHAVQQPTWTRA